MSPRHSDLRVADILNTIEQVENLLQGVERERFLKDNHLQAAVCWYVFLIGEAAIHLDRKVKESIPEVNWQDVKGMRNHLAHGYFRLDMVVVWDVVTVRLPELKRVLAPWRR